ncbi:hypothetical protein ABZT47_16215 [Sphaerisporangium sp. NPDC005289]|uniref:hypothetical protein n=1 Tax=Sphaerisporangium sp. NPDC005289 TaxID=3155247 RepID=UPI0033A49F30
MRCPLTRTASVIPAALLAAALAGCGATTTGAAASAVPMPAAPRSSAPYPADGPQGGSPSPPDGSAAATGTSGTVGASRTGGPSSTGGRDAASTDSKGEPRRLVAQWESFGGFAGTRRDLTPPKIAVYGDGLVVAGAERRVTVKPAEVTALVRTLRRDLGGQAATPSPTAGPRVSDAMTTVLAVRSGGTMRSVTAYALQETRSQHDYPAALYHALDTMNGLAARVARTSSPYTAGRVLLVAQPRPGESGAPWPGPVPQPSATNESIAIRHLSGAKARAVVRLVHRDPKKGAWPLYRDHHDHTYALSWRYLLPSE